MKSFNRRLLTLKYPAGRMSRAKLLRVAVMQGLGSHDTGLLEGADRLFHIGPGGILGQDGPDADLEGRFGRPPAEGAEPLKETVVYFP